MLNLRIVARSNRCIFMVGTFLSPGLIFAQNKSDSELARSQSLGSGKTYSNQINGYGNDPKEFEKLGNTPQPIQEIAHKSMRRLCACSVTLSNCITIFAFGSGFLTNAHAMEALESTFKTPEILREGCPNKFLLVEPDGKSTNVKMTVKRRGFYPQASEQVGGPWKPEEFFDAKLEDVRDHTHDLALLTIEGLRLPVTPIHPGKGNYRLGQKVYHLGFSSGPGVSYTDSRTAAQDPLPQVSSGQISGMKARNIEADFLGVNGTSGGPVLSEDGLLQGVFWGKEKTFRESSPNLGKWIPAHFERNEGEAGRQLVKAHFEKADNSFIDQNGYPHERSYFMPLTAVEDFSSDQ